MIGEIGNASEQAAAAVKVLLYVGPVAGYVLWIALVNSHGTPKAVRAQDDFLAMTVAFCPFVAAAVLSLLRAGYGWAAVATVALTLLLFLRLLPRKNSGWVIYNLSPRRAWMLTDRSLRALGWAYRWDGQTARVADKGLSLEMSFVPPLRNVTFHISPCGPQPQADDIEALRAELFRRLAGETCLPSASACGLLLAGVGLLILPLWMLSHHSAAIAEVMTQFLLS
ncbi:MAG: hypothetical protein KAV82_03175 [Phycisphaerae bacterium]|nr:hypothetical protein [Phycisphaerae bacterium]